MYFVSSVAVLLLVFARFLPESPRYLLSHGRVKEAEAVLERIAAWNQALLPPGTLVATIDLDADIRAHQEEQQQQVLQTQEAYAKQSEQRSFSPDVQHHSTDSVSPSSSRGRQPKGLGSPSSEQRQQRYRARSSEAPHDPEQELAPWHPSSEVKDTTAATTSSWSRDVRGEEVADEREDGDKGGPKVRQHEDGGNGHDVDVHDEHAVLLLDDAERQLLLVSEGGSLQGEVKCRCICVAALHAEGGSEQGKEPCWTMGIA